MMAEAADVSFSFCPDFTDPYLLIKIFISEFYSYIFIPFWKTGEYEKDRSVRSDRNLYFLHTLRDSSPYFIF